MRIAEDPTNQKKVDTGEANHKRGRPESQFKQCYLGGLDLPITNRPM
jgi:hypothetical protein